MHLFSVGWFDEDHSNYTVLDSLGWCFFREAEKTIVLISNLGVQILDAATAKIIESPDPLRINLRKRIAFDDLGCSSIKDLHPQIAD